MAKIAISDHYPVSMTWKRYRIIPNNGENNILVYRDKSNFNKDNFFNYLERFMVFTDETYSVENAVNAMTSTFTSVLNNHAKLRQKRVKGVSNLHGLIFILEMQSCLEIGQKEMVAC